MLLIDKKISGNEREQQIYYKCIQHWLDHFVVVYYVNQFSAVLHQLIYFNHLENVRLFSALITLDVMLRSHFC